MVVMYDAVKKLNITMLGSMEARCKEEGVLGAIDRVCHYKLFSSPWIIFMPCKTLSRL